VALSCQVNKRHKIEIRPVKAHVVARFITGPKHYLGCFFLSCQLPRGNAYDFVTIKQWHMLVTINLQTSHNKFVMVAF